MFASSSQGRLIVHKSDSGAMNMSIDQAILESTAASTTPTLRFYRWKPATLSLGYFQKARDRKLHLASSNCPVVRRASGGGAILHDNELTYSLCVASAGPIAKANAELYDIVHLATREALKEQGIEVSLFQAPTAAPVKAAADDPFLCFERRAVGDIVCNGAKIGGSAQRRLKNALIQHGSFLLSRSDFAPELLGIKELIGIEVDVEKLMEGIASRLSGSLNIQFQHAELSAVERSRAAEVAEQKFASNQWTQRR